MSASFYSISHFSAEHGAVSARIRLHADHPLFAGHFPGQPVLPGVCQLAVVKELAEKALKRKLVMRHADQVKFLAMVDPVRVPELKVELSFTDTLTLQAVIKEGELIFLKTKCTFIDA